MCQEAQTHWPVSLVQLPRPSEMISGTEQIRVVRGIPFLQSEKGNDDIQWQSKQSVLQKECVTSVLQQVRTASWMVMVMALVLVKQPWTADRDED